MKEESKKMAKRMYEMMETKKRGDEVICVTKDGQYDTPEMKILRDHLFKECPHTELDFLWENVYYALSSISENGVEAVEENISEYAEPDCYTSQLTGWLHSSAHNVYYLEEAMESGVKDGFQLLSMAQGRAKEEIVYAVISAIKELVEGLEDELDNEGLSVKPDSIDEGGDYTGWKPNPYRTQKKRD